MGGGGGSLNGGKAKQGGGGGVDLKFHSKVILLAQKILNTTFDPISQKSSASVFQNWHKIIFFYISMFVVSVIIAGNE